MGPSGGGATGAAGGGGLLDNPLVKKGLKEVGKKVKDSLTEQPKYNNPDLPDVPDIPSSFTDPVRIPAPQYATGGDPFDPGRVSYDENFNPVMNNSVWDNPDAYAGALPVDPLVPNTLPGTGAIPDILTAADPMFGVGAGAGGAEGLMGLAGAAPDATNLLSSSEPMFGAGTEAGAFNPANYEGTLYNPNDPFGLTDPIQTGGGDWWSFMDKAGTAMSYAALAKTLYDVMATDADAATKANMLVRQGVPAALALTVGGPAGAVAAAMYGALGVAEAIEQNNNKPSRDYYDPYMGFDLGDGYRAMLGVQTSDLQDQALQQDWNSAIDQIAMGGEFTNFIMGPNGEVYSVPQEYIFDKGLMDPAMAEQDQLVQDVGMGENMSPQEIEAARRQWIAETYTPEYIQQRLSSYLEEGNYNIPGMTLFKDTPVYAFGSPETGYTTGKDPLVVSSVYSAFGDNPNFLDYDSYVDMITQQRQVNPEMDYSI
jgi:hypothetical protein